MSWEVGKPAGSESYLHRTGAESPRTATSCAKEEEFGITYSGGAGGSDTGSGFGGHESGDLYDLGVVIFNGGSGFGGLGEEGNGSGGGGCTVYFGERFCGGYGFGPN